jgi:acetyl-CoA acetyltransferase
MSVSDSLFDQYLGSDVSEAFVYEAIRTPRGRGKHTGSLHGTKPVSLVVGLLKELCTRHPELDPTTIDDLVLRVVSPVGDQGSVLARTAALAAGLPDTVAGLQVNRFCGSGLEAVNIAAQKVRSGWDQLVVAGAVESMSRVPIGADGGAWSEDPETNWDIRFVPQGVSADLIATLEGFSREDVDRYAVQSQQRAAAAWSGGFFAKSVVPVRDRNGLVLLDHDEFMRPSSTLESLTELKPAFVKHGAVVRQRDELSGLLGVVAEDDAIGVGQDADRVTVQRAPARDKAGAVAGFVLVELRAVEDPGKHFARLERHPQLGRGHASELGGGVVRLPDRARLAAVLLPVPAGDDLPTDANGIALVGGEVVAQPAGEGVHGCTAQFLVGGDLAGRHLHEGRAAQEHLALLVKHHRVVAHARDVGAAGRRVAEDQGDAGDAHGRQLREVAELLTGTDEELRLARQVTPAGLDELQHRKPVLPGDLHRPVDLLPGVGVAGAALHGGIVGEQHALDAFDHPDARDDAGFDGVVGAPGGER